MKTRIPIVALLCAALFALPNVGCQSSGTKPDPTVQLTELADAFDVTLNALTLADQSGLVKPEWKPAIAQAYVAAKAALAQMQANVQTNPSQFQAALSDFNAALAALVQYRQQAAATTQPIGVK